MIVVERGEREGEGGSFFDYNYGMEGENCLGIAVASLKLVALRLLDREMERKGGRLPEVGVLGFGLLAWG